MKSELKERRGESPCNARRNSLAVLVALGASSTLCGFGPALTCVLLAQGRGAIGPRVSGAYRGSDAQFLSFVLQSSFSTALWALLGVIALVHVVGRDRVLRSAGLAALALFLGLLIWGLSQMTQPLVVVQ
jgi:hypothetical protein